MSLPIRLPFALSLVLIAGFVCALDEEATAAPPKGVKPGLPQFDGAPPIVRPEKTQVLGQHQDQIVAVAISENGRWLISCSKDGDCRAWDTQGGRELSRFEKPLEGKKFCIAVANDGKHAVIGGEFKAVHVWDIRTGKIVFTHDAFEAEITHVAVSEDDKWVVGAAADGGLFRSPLLGGKGNVVNLPALKQPFDFFAAAGDGSAAVVGYFRGLGYVIQFPKPGAPINILNAAFYISGGPSQLFTGVRHAAIGPRGEKVALVNTGFGQTITLKSGKRGAIQFQNVDSHSRGLEGMELISDAELIAAVGHRFIEVRPVEALSATSWVDLGSLHATALDINRSGRMIGAGAAPNNRVVVVKLPELSLPPQGRFMIEVVEALRKKDYDRLEQMAEAVAQDDRTGFSWGSGNSKYTLLLKTLNNESIYLDEPGAAAERLKEWNKKQPKAVLPRLAMADHYSELAWKARGTGFAEKVSEKGREGFAANLELMEEQLKGIEPSEKTPDDFFRLVLNLAKDQGWDREQTSRYADLLMKRAPHYAQAHAAMADYLMPRWHGEPGESEEYARKVADRIGGPEGNAVYAQMALSLVRYCTPEVSSRDFFAQELDFDLDRVWEGLMHLKTKSPDTPWVVADLVYAAWLREDRGAAKQYLDRLKELTPYPELARDEQLSIDDLEKWIKSP